METIIKDESNPIGTAFVDENIDNFVSAMSASWDASKETSPWWKFWKKISLTRVTTFLLAGLDDLIAYVDEALDNGPDKKATVLDAVSRLYDYVIAEALPIYLKPFAGAIKNYVINDLISPSIDWIVDKYRNGDWRKKTVPELTAQWTAMGNVGSVLPK